jgi:hypothetical protein
MTIIWVMGGLKSNVLEICSVSVIKVYHEDGDRMSPERWFWKHSQMFFG